MAGEKYFPGQIVNGVKIIERIKNPYFICMCPYCSNVWKVRIDHIRTHAAPGCGCRSAKHGHTNNKGFRSPTYLTWVSMMNRCYKADEFHKEHYQDRGIIVCERWHDFNNFLQDMGERPNGKTLDRLNNDGNYELDNCRWASGKQQQRNLRNNVVLTYKGNTKTLPEWCEDLDLSYFAVYERIKGRGWSVEEAFEKPIRQTKRRAA